RAHGSVGASQYADPDGPSRVAAGGSSTGAPGSRDTSRSADTSSSGLSATDAPFHCTSAHSPHRCAAGGGADSACGSGGPSHYANTHPSVRPAPHAPVLPATTLFRSRAHGSVGASQYADPDGPSRVAAGGSSTGAPGSRDTSRSAD